MARSARPRSRESSAVASTFHARTLRRVGPLSSGIAWARTPRSIPTATAGTPYTTACSPRKSRLAAGNPRVANAALYAGGAQLSRSPRAFTAPCNHDFPRGKSGADASSRSACDRSSASRASTTGRATTRSVPHQRLHVRVASVLLAERSRHQVLSGGVPFERRHERRPLPAPDVVPRRLPGCSRVCERPEQNRSRSWNATPSGAANRSSDARCSAPAPARMAPMKRAPHGVAAGLRSCIDSTW